MSNKLTTWEPMRELQDIRNRLSSFFSGRDNDLTISRLTDMKTSDWHPAVDISEDDKEYLIIADLPEVSKDEVKVAVENGVLSISGERRSKSEEKDEKRKYHRIERSFGSYMRSFRLPEDVEENKIDADFKDGVLHVHLPKGEPTQKKKIEVT